MLIPVSLSMLRYLKIYTLVLVEEAGLTLKTNLKNVWFFTYYLRMERGTVLILTWLTAHYHYL